ncbi:MAG: hypothetical protein AAFW00_28930, partial [Bacteroidota bacterium]
VQDYFPYGETLRKFVASGAEERFLTTQHERDDRPLRSNADGLIGIGRKPKANLSVSSILYIIGGRGFMMGRRLGFCLLILWQAIPIRLISLLTPMFGAIQLSSLTQTGVAPSVQMRYTYQLPIMYMTRK